MLPILMLTLLSAQETSVAPRHPDPARKVTLQRPELPHRREAREYLRKALSMGGAVDTETALASTLDALARTQTEDGSWDPSEGGSRLEVTGLALLAFLDAGYHTWDQEMLSRSPPWRFGDGGASLWEAQPYHRVVRRGISYVYGFQQHDGFLGWRNSPHALRAHAIGTKALSEAYGWSRQELMHEPAQLALNVLIAERFPAIGVDAETTAWAALALRAAAVDGLDFDRAVFDQLVPNLNSGGSAPRQRAVEYLLWYQLLGAKRLPAGFRYSKPPRDLPSADLRDWFWGSMALREWDAPKGPVWKDWNERMKSALLPMTGEGSEELVYRALTLESYYRDNVFFLIK